jgi:antitoxin component YwqK of YwqJK toxin-antitoxin module
MTSIDLETNDLPTYIKNGDKYWYKNGKIHRDDDLPAVVCYNSTKYWYQNGKLHRDNNLPAVIMRNGDKYWYENGNPVRYEKFSWLKMLKII